MMLKYTGGGTDQRNTLEAVKWANVCLLKEFSLDMLITVRCAPGQSYINPAERVMSILNYGLQNVSIERTRMDTEAILKPCNSSNQIREKAKEHPFLIEKWKSSVSTVQNLLSESERFRRLSLKN